MVDILFYSNAFDIAVFLKSVFHLLCERQMVGRVMATESSCQKFLFGGKVSVVFRNAEFGEIFLRESAAGGLDEVVILHAFVVFERAGVDVDLVVDNLQGVVWFGYAAFDVVLASVNRTIDHLSEHIFSLMDEVFAVVVAQ